MPYSMMKEHFKNVVSWNRMTMKDGSSIIHMTDGRSDVLVPELRQIKLHWTMRSVGMTAQSMTAAKCALSLRTGNHVRVHRSSKSVAAWRLRMGDTVSVSSMIQDEPMYEFMDMRTTMVIPQFRPFNGYLMDCVDNAGNCTLPMMMPMAFPQIESNYELLIPLCSRPGMSVTIYTNSSRFGGTTDEIRERSLKLLTGLGVPFVG